MGENDGEGVFPFFNSGADSGLLPAVKSRKGFVQYYHIP